MFLLGNLRPIVWELLFPPPPPSRHLAPEIKLESEDSMHFCVKPEILSRRQDPGPGIISQHAKPLFVARVCYIYLGGNLVPDLLGGGY